jgi:hypothetical protein
MPPIRQFQTTTKDNLRAYFYIGGNLSDPFSVTYTLYDSTTGTPEVIGLPDRTPIKFATGSFYAPWTIPDDEPLGVHKVIWNYKENATSAVKTDTEEFEVLGPCVGTEVTYPPFLQYMIHELRIKLRDINPDRDYHFSAPSGEATIAGFTRTRGYRWPDESLYSHLVQAANYINLYPPDTGFVLENYPAVWQPLVLLQAMSYALWDLAILWMNEEFSYSLNGISLDIMRSDKYQSAASAMQDTVNQQIELAKKRIHITKGLAQNRYIFGRGAALGPWCLHKDNKVFDLDNKEQITIEEAFKRQIKKSYSMNLKTNELIENEVVQIWSNGVQELYKMTTVKHEEISTKTHKYFNEKNEEIELQNLEIGDKIWVYDEAKTKLYLEEITNKEYYGNGDTYDMEMKEPFRNYIANNIVVHNTGGQNVKRWIMGSGIRIGGGSGGMG